jgi:CheY-like chemotaxis protein
MARILVLDKANVIERVRGQLTSFGHQVFAADTDAYAALSEVANANADLMIIALDLQGGGVQLIDRLRTDPATKQTPIIVLFSDNWTGIKPDNITRLLQKPTDPDTLKFLLDELLALAPRKAPAAAPEMMPEMEDSLPPLGPPLGNKPPPMDMGAPNDDDLPPGETLEL